MRGPRQLIAAIILGFESVVIFLGSLVLFGLDALTPWGLPDWSALIGGAVLLGLCVLALATLRWPVGFVLGWLVQGVLLLAGVLNLALLIAGAMFTAMWWWGLRAGRRLEQQASAAEDSDTLNA